VQQRTQLHAERTMPIFANLKVYVHKPGPSALAALSESQAYTAQLAVRPPRPG
jgi:hypothetical protein